VILSAFLIAFLLPQCVGGHVAIISFALSYKNDKFLVDFDRKWPRDFRG